MLLLWPAWQCCGQVAGHAFEGIDQPVQNGDCWMSSHAPPRPQGGGPDSSEHPVGVAGFPSARLVFSCTLCEVACYIILDKLRKEEARFFVIKVYIQRNVFVVLNIFPKVFTMTQM